MKRREFARILESIVPGGLRDRRQAPRRRVVVTGLREEATSRRPSRLLGIVALLLPFGMAGQAGAGPLNPNDFMPMGALGSGSYVIDSGGQLTGGAPTIYSLSNGSLTALATGVVSNGIAVFDYSSVNLNAGSSLVVDDFTVFKPIDTNPFASRPVALLSRGDVTLAGVITVMPDALGGPGAGGMPQTFQFPPNPGPPNFAVGGSGGGGFGTAGRAGESLTVDIPPMPPMTVAGGAGGGTYGDLSQRLQQGSQGYPESFVGGFPGFGGGAIELGAVGTITISGSISAAGGMGATGGGGGGSGGAIYVHAPVIDLVNSDPFSVGGGGGGRGGLFGRVNEGAGGDGGLGLVLVQTVPEPSSLVLSGIAGLMGVATALRRRRRTATA